MHGSSRSVPYVRGSSCLSQASGRPFMQLTQEGRDSAWPTCRNLRGLSQSPMKHSRCNLLRPRKRAFLTMRRPIALPSPQSSALRLPTSSGFRCSLCSQWRRPLPSPRGPRHYNKMRYGTMKQKSRIAQVNGQSADNRVERVRGADALRPHAEMARRLVLIGGAGGISADSITM